MPGYDMVFTPSEVEQQSENLNYRVYGRHGHSRRGAVEPDMVFTPSEVEAHERNRPADILTFGWLAKFSAR